MEPTPFNAAGKTAMKPKATSTGGSAAESLRIEGIPRVDGAYWYYKLGESMPTLVLVGEYEGERAIKDGPAIQRYWFPGEFFVGPISPPFATPAELAAPPEDVWRQARENPITLEAVQALVKRIAALHGAE
jgi:hypothetical protein